MGRTNTAGLQCDPRSGIWRTRLVSVPERVTGAPPNWARPKASNDCPVLRMACTISHVGGCSVIPRSGSVLETITILSTSLNPSW